MPKMGTNVSAPKTAKRKATVAIDFDGVLHPYSRGWADGSIYDLPAAGSAQFLRALLDKFHVFVHSSRPAEQIMTWCVQNYPDAFLFEVVPADAKFWSRDGVIGITDRKLPAVAYLDDRAVVFNPTIFGGSVEATFRHALQVLNSLD